MWKKILLSIAGVLVAVLVGLFVAYRIGLYAADAPPEEPLAITGAALIDGTGADPVEDATILIQEGTIEAAGPADAVSVPETAERLSADGLTIVPGLIDAHVHFGAPEVETYEEFEDLSLVGTIWDAIRANPDTRRSFVEHGVTTIKSAGDSDDLIFRAREAIENHELEGPRIRTAGPVFTAPGGHPAGTIYEGNDYLIETATRQVKRPSEAREQVAEVDELGADLIKTVVDGGNSAHGDLPTLEPEVLEAIVDEAHGRDLPVTTHWSAPDEARVALDAGADALEHAGNSGTVDSTLARRIGDADVEVVPTLAVTEAVMPEEVLERALENVARLHEAGVDLVAGTDAANPGVAFGESLHRELELLARAGLSPEEALEAATARAAEHLRMEGEVGTVEPGKTADLVGVAGDPLDDISATREVELVVREGKVLVGEGGP